MTPKFGEVAERKGVPVQGMVGEVVTLKVEKGVTVGRVGEIDLEAGTYIFTPFFSGEPITLKINDDVLD